MSGIERPQFAGGRDMTPKANNESAVVLPQHAAVSQPARSADDPRVIAAMEEYSAALRAGLSPDRQAFLAAHAHLAEPLAKCLDGMEFLRKAAPSLGWSRERHSDARDEI